MTTYKELKTEFEKKLEEIKAETDKKIKVAEEEFNKKVLELQKKCTHPKVAVIITKGHDKEEKICEICNAVVKKAKITIHMP
ncbi:MAG: hypothetical protein ACTSRG_16245 [Candidatus Helarchaeota archaeon]